MTMVIITGENRAGKSTTKDLLERAIRRSGICSVQTFEFRSYFEKALNALNIEPTRPNLQKISIVLREAFGEDIVADAIIQEIRKSKPDAAIVCGLRWPRDLKVLHSFAQNYLIHVTASIELRCERNNTIREKSGLPPQGLTAFRLEETSKADAGVAEISKTANIQIINSNTEDQLNAAVQKIWQDIITPPF